MKVEEDEMAPVIVFEPATAHSDAVVRPVCSVCGTATLLVGIDQSAPATNYALSSAQRADILKPQSGKSRRTPQLAALSPRRLPDRKNKPPPCPLRAIADIAGRKQSLLLAGALGYSPSHRIGE